MQGVPGLQITETRSHLAKQLLSIFRRVVVGEETHLSGYPTGLSFIVIQNKLVYKLLSCSLCVAVDHCAGNHARDKRSAGMKYSSMPALRAV
jgi:hypothetical protein